MTNYIRSMLVGMVLLVPALPVAAEARFHGVLDDQGRPVPVTLSFVNGTQGTVAGTLRLDGAWACGFDLESSGVHAQAASYFLKGAGAGRCAVLSAGYLHQHATSDGFAIELRDRSNTAPGLYSLEVQPAAG